MAMCKAIEMLGGMSPCNLVNVIRVKELDCPQPFVCIFYKEFLNLSVKFSKLYTR
jgi:hypothetical protein